MQGVSDCGMTFIFQLVDKKTFKTPREFREESQWMFHNAIIYFGGNHQFLFCTSEIACLLGGGGGGGYLPNDWV